ncbi:3243_t:CDS:2, partial [Racocetra fulgida]
MQNSNFAIKSGGQTGVERGTLDAARDFNTQTDIYDTIINITGWCPKGRRAEDGQISDEYPLKETATDIYLSDNQENVPRWFNEHQENVLRWLNEHQENVLRWLNEHQINHLN